MLSNYVSNQRIDGYTEVLIISKNLYSQIIQIGLSSRAIVVDPESSKVSWEKFQSLFVESMYVITTLMTKCEDEDVFF